MLTEALRTQKIFENAEEIARKIAQVTTIEKYAAGETLFTQGDASNDIFFILVGHVSIQINGREVNSRRRGEHVGEMAAIDVHARRSASVVAIDETVVAKISEPHFAAIAAEYPSIWRQLASELAERIRQRGSSVVQRNLRPRLFIGSSSEGLEIARACQSSLQYDDFDVRVWTDGVFQASKATIEDLEREVKSIDFGVLVLTHDDKIESRGNERMGPRDNVIFEFGLIMGAIGRDRTFALQPRGIDLKIPSDLLGVRPLSYNLSGELPASIGPACNELREIIQRLGTR